MSYIGSLRNSLSICYGPNFQVSSNYIKCTDGIDWSCYALLFHHGTFPSFSMTNKAGSPQVSIMLQITENLAAILPKIRLP